MKLDFFPAERGIGESDAKPLEEMLCTRCHGNPDLRLLLLLYPPSRVSTPGWRKK